MPNTLISRPLTIPSRKRHEVVYTENRRVILKRLFDIVLSPVLLLVLMPLMALIAALIKLDSRGPALFRQRRIGMNGLPFTVYKFRTMRPNAHDQWHKLAQDHGLQPKNFKIKQDPRITHLGRFLRTYSLDELPQLLNVLKGEMSLIGPRPHPIEAFENLIDDPLAGMWAMERHRVPPGMTGLWQVSGRNDLPFSELVRLDLYYVKNWSLALDVRIFMKTFGVVLSQKGAY